MGATLERSLEVEEEELKEEEEKETIAERGEGTWKGRDGRKEEKQRQRPIAEDGILGRA